MEMEKETTQSSHQGTGNVASVDKAKLTVKLTHEAIKSLGWPGMEGVRRVPYDTLLISGNGTSVVFTHHSIN
jgi:Cu/Ag efflux protein CusF